MQQVIMGSTLFALSCLFLLQTACGPSCPEINSSKEEKDLMTDDSSRVNKLVERRKALIEKAKSGEVDKYKMERIKFSVTAYELAIEMQLMIVKISPNGTAPNNLYNRNIDEIDETRCFLDDVLKGNVLKMERLEISDSLGKKIQERYQRLSRLFQGEANLPVSALKKYFENGMNGSQN